MFFMVRIKKIKLSNKSVNPAKKIVLKKEPMTALRFITRVLWGTAVALIFISIFTVYGSMIFIDRVNKMELALTNYKNNLALGEVVYRNDKISYRSDEAINLDIVNNSNESIYLAPCQYFNVFEKKISDQWETISLADCTGMEVSTDSTSIEKISKKAEDYVLANELGAGIWRGVSTVYFGCKKAQAESCKNSQKIYTNEFTINDPVLASNSEPQL